MHLAPAFIRAVIFAFMPCMFGRNLRKRNDFDDLGLRDANRIAPSVQNNIVLTRPGNLFSVKTVRLICRSRGRLFSPIDQLSQVIRLFSADAKSPCLNRDILFNSVFCTKIFPIFSDLFIQFKIPLL